MTTLLNETKIPWFGSLIKEKKTIIDDNNNDIIIVIIIIIINEETSPFSSIPSLEIFFPWVTRFTKKYTSTRQAGRFASKQT